MRLRNLLLQGLIWIIVIGLLIWVLRSVPLQDVLTVFQRFSPYQLFILFVVNAVVLLLFGGRWWVLLATLGYSLSYAKVALHRLAGFGVSYFTPGPQVGGEPVQIKLLQSHVPQVPIAIGIASLTLDRLFEIIVNLTLVLIGLTITLQFQFSNQSYTWGLFIVVGLIIGLLVLLIAFAMGFAPTSHLCYQLPESIVSRPRIHKIHQIIQDSENHMIYLFQKRPIGVFGGLLFSILSWIGIIGEYWLIAHYLGVTLNWVQLISVLTAFQISFALPLPGGLGSLEAGQVFMYDRLGLDPAIGLSVSLFMRGRDVLFGLAGLWWAGYAWKHKSEPSHNNTSHHQ